MAKQVEPEQASLLAELEAEREVLQELRAREDESKERVWALIVKGFRSGVSGVKLSRSSGLSQSRIYQIRDETNAQEEASV